MCDWKLYALYEANDNMWQQLLQLDRLRFNIELPLVKLSSKNTAKCQNYFINKTI